MTLQALKPRFRFTIRALLVLMTLLALWCAYSMNWIRQRRELVRSGVVKPAMTSKGLHAVTPGWLGMFGEPGYFSLMVDAPHGSPEFDRIQALFSEARCTGNLTQSGNPF
ncbi:hypothetical protein I41_52570 [Lacipirellula limnantheis]|uniref:Uncharacterized protein n=1 Tax=Lacipirellula limnantheis TaxID=2528024 RepID=A0A517U5V1_9BACT|nr:hypothetical protein I41_52570 [Lacipirellula limnantheis]